MSARRTIGIVCLVGALVLIVSVVANVSQSHPASGAAVVEGAAAVVLLALGALTMRRPLDS